MKIRTKFDFFEFLLRKREEKEKEKERKKSGTFFEIVNKIV